MPPTFSTKWTRQDFGFDQLKVNLERLAQRPLITKVGVLSAEPAGEGDFTLAELAATLEFGTRDGRIPPRPVWRTTLRSSALRDFIRAQVRNFARAKFTNEVYYASRIAAYAAGLVQKNMPNFPPPNAPSTIAKKGSDVTMIDTGRYRQSISWAIEEGAPQPLGNEDTVPDAPRG